MAFDFPNSPTIGQAYGNYLWDGEKWTLPNLVDPIAARKSVYAAPFDALAYSGMQINGSMDVSQERGYSVANVTNTWACDGWVFTFTGTMVAVSGLVNNTSMFPGFQNILVTTVTTAQASLGAGDLLNVAQKIEGYRLARLAWGTASAQPLTIGFWTNHHRAGTYCVSFRNPSANRSYVATYTQNVADTSEYKTITVPGCTDGVWPVDNTIGMYINFSFACGTTYQGVSANTWLTTNSLAVAAQVNGAASTSDVFRITGVVILPGIEAPSAARSPLIMRPYDQELLTCKRYYEQFVVDHRTYFSVAGWVSQYTLSFIPKRALPALPQLSVSSTTNVSSYTLTTSSISTATSRLVAAAIGDCSILAATYAADARL